MTHYTAVALTPTTDAWIPGYMENVPEIVARHGGRYVVRADDYQRIEGEAAGADAAMIVIIEWPNKEAETAFMTDRDYAPYHEARLAGATNNSFSLPGLD